MDRLRVGRWRGWGGSLAYIQSMSDTVISNASSCLHKRGWDEGSLGGTRRQGKSHLGPLILTGKERGGSWAKSLIALICTAPLYLWQLMPVFFFVCLFIRLFCSLMTSHFLLKYIYLRRKKKLSWLQYTTLTK